MFNSLRKKPIEVIAALVLLVVYPAITELLKLSSESSRLLFMSIVTTAAVFFVPKNCYIAPQVIEKEKVLHIL